MDRIGILVDRRVLARAMRGRPTIERVGLYRSVALELGVDIVVFCVERVDVKRAAVVGYAPAGEGWRRVRVPLPRWSTSGSSTARALPCESSGGCSAAGWSSSTR